MYQNFNVKSDAKYSLERVQELRSLMKQRKLDGVIVPKVDRYQGEYIPKEEERLSWLSGFTGSAGTALILKKTAVLFVDGRYTLQATKEVNRDIFSIINSTKISISDWMNENCLKREIIAFDPWLTTVAQVNQLREKSRKQYKLEAASNLIDQMWQRNFNMAKSTVFCLANKYSGETFKSKLTRINKLLSDKKIRNYLFCKPDAICWLLNIRGDDIDHNPLVNCMALLKSDGAIIIFSENPKKFSKLLQNVTFKNVKFEEYSTLGKWFARLEETIGLDPYYLPWKIHTLLKSKKANIIYFEDPANSLKCIKNNSEIRNAKSAHRIDATAFIKCMYWFSQLSKEIEIDEISLIKKLEFYRKETGCLKGISFDTICGSGPNGAVIHYRATEKTNRIIKSNDLILIDSGGQYLEGTTDLTRTISREECDKDTKKLYTMVLKGLIALSSQVWPEGLTGQDLDPFARQFLWNSYNDYDHGTGHGVGSYLCVHEGPIGIHKTSKTVLKPGMVLSIEPGFYKKGKFGIRLENLVVVKKSKRAGNKDYLSFESLSCVPFQKNLLDLNCLESKEREWLNTYHSFVFNSVSSNLSQNERDWLQVQCQPIIIN